MAGFDFVAQRTWFNARGVSSPEPEIARPETNSDAGTRTRVARVRAEYPNQLDYIGSLALGR